MREVVGVVIIKNSHVLLVKKQKVWILPGGKPEDGESDRGCLEREISEELPGLNLASIKYFGSFTGIAPHKKDKLCVRVYFADTHIVDEKIVTGAEINAARWLRRLTECDNLSDVTRKIVLSLEQRGYL